MARGFKRAGGTQILFSAGIHIHRVNAQREGGRPRGSATFIGETEDREGGNTAGRWEISTLRLWLHSVESVWKGEHGR